ncbi:MAG: DUF262 domain-containing protein [Leptospiraceae bacterium]|nr:DUF262 domain-containing protein [Leptospiraceae bacterium]
MSDTNSNTNKSLNEDFRIESSADSSFNIEKELFEQNLEIFEKADTLLAEYFFDILNDLIKYFQIDFSDHRIKLSVKKTGQSGFSLHIGNKPVITIKREFSELILEILQPSGNHLYKSNPCFRAVEGKNKPNKTNPFNNVSFLFQKFDIEKNKIKEQWYEIVKSLLEKNPKARRDSHNQYFYEIITNKTKRKEALKSLPAEISDKYKRVVENEEEEFEDYVFDPKDINISIEQRSLDTLISRIEYKEIDMSPDFQRNSNLWSDQMMSRFIESILLRLPLPAFYFDATDDKYWLVVDGLQRLFTIYKFVLLTKEKEGLKLSGLKILKDLNNKTYDELPGEYKRRIKECQATCNLIKPVTPPAVKYSIFHRINTGGLRLNNQEIRNALNQRMKDKQAEGPKLLKELADSDEFKEIIKISSKRMQDREVVLRYIAFQIVPAEDYKGSMRTFLDQAMEELNKKLINEPKLKEELELRFKTSLKRAQSLFGEKAFSRESGRGSINFNRALFDVWGYYLSKLSNQQTELLLKNKKQIIEEFNNLLESDFEETIVSSTTSTANVERRFEEIFTLLKNYIPDFYTEWKSDK